MIRSRYKLTFVDMTTGKVLLVRGSDWPDYRAFMPDLPVSIQCEEIEVLDEVAPVLALAA